MSTSDRRSARREATIDEILEVAIELMAAEGPGALSLAEVARRIGVRPPSLYQYFPSKLAVYDELFARGARALLEATVAATEGLTDPLETLRAGMRAFVAWAVAHPVHAQILFWRPVPGFVPSQQAYGFAAQTIDQTRAALRECVRRKALAPAAASDRGLDLLTSMVTGLISQQLSNQPDVTTVDGRFASLTDEVLDMFVARFAPIRRSAKR